MKDDKYSISEADIFRWGDTRVGIKQGDCLATSRRRIFMMSVPLWWKPRIRLTFPLTRGGGSIRHHMRRARPPTNMARYLSTVYTKPICLFTVLNILLSLKYCFVLLYYIVPFTELLPMTVNFFVILLEKYSLKYWQNWASFELTFVYS